MWKTGVKDRLVPHIPCFSLASGFRVWGARNILWLHSGSAGCQAKEKYWTSLSVGRVVDSEPNTFSPGHTRIYWRIGKLHFLYFHSHTHTKISFTLVSLTFYASITFNYLIVYHVVGSVASIRGENMIKKTWIRSLFCGSPGHNLNVDTFGKQLSEESGK